MATMPPLPDRVTLAQIRDALTALGVTDRQGVTGFSADLFSLTITRHVRDEHGAPTGAREITIIPIG